MVQEFYHEVAGTPIQTGMVIAHQTFGDMMRFNPHYHAIIVEGGFNDEGKFISIPFAGLQKMTEYFRRKVIWLFVKRADKRRICPKSAFMETFRVQH